VHDRTKRQLLSPGDRERFDIGSIRLMSSQFDPGSRLVLVLSVIKESGRESNYGIGKAVIDETVRDAATSLEIKWYGDSYLDVPVTNPVPFAASDFGIAKPAGQ